MINFYSSFVFGGYRLYWGSFVLQSEPASVIGTPLMPVLIDKHPHLIDVVSIL